MTVQRWLAVGLLLAGPVVARASSALLPTDNVALIASAFDPSTDDVSSFTVDNKTQVPGKTLKPGSYTIRIVDHLSDRMILRIDRDGKQESTFLALPVSNLPRPSGQGPIKLSGSAKGGNAIRGFAFPSGTLAEFVYPKEEAVGIAKANNTTIPAVDPASEGRSANPELSSEDMKMVTLWMLSPTPVGPDGSKAGISASRFQVANAAPPPPPPVATPSPAPAPSSRQVASVQVPPRPRSRPAMAALPHTASPLPLIGLTGLLSLGFAGMLALRRRSAW